MVDYPAAKSFLPNALHAFPLDNRLHDMPHQLAITGPIIYTFLFMAQYEHRTNPTANASLWLSGMVQALRSLSGSFLPGLASHHAGSFIEAELLE